MIIIPGGIGGLQRRCCADINEPLGRDGTASVIQIKADGVIGFGNRAGAFILNAAVVDTTADCTIVRNLTVELGASTGICGLNPAIFFYINCIINNTAVHGTAVIGAYIQTAAAAYCCAAVINGAAIHGKAIIGVHTNAAAILCTAVINSAAVHGKIAACDTSAAAII